MTREEAIINLKLSQNRIGGMKKEEWNALQMAIEALQDRPKGDWIPCSREKPDKNKPVLISGIHRTSGQRGVDIARYSGMVWQYDGFTFPDIKIEAWMPLPEPFEGGEIE